MAYYEMRFGPPLTPTVRLLLIINSAVFVVQFLLDMFATDYLIYFFALQPGDINHLQLWELITYAFLHGSIFHLLFNMLALWMFGSELEGYWGSKTFLRFYLFSCFMGGVLTYVVHMLGFPQGIVLGASGGIFGLLIAFAMIWPNREIYFMALFPIKAKYLVLILMVIIFFSDKGNIAHMAHFGGLIGGFLYLKFIQKMDIKLPGFSFSRMKQKQKMRKWQEEMNQKQFIREEVDRLLDKISREGMSSLTRKEKKFLKEASGQYYSEE